MPAQADRLERASPPKDSRKPFDSSAKKADIILRSSDSIDFFVLEPLLRIVSPVFEDMCSANQESNDRITVESKLPVMQVDESSGTLYHLLLLIYPYEKLLIQDGDLFLNVAAAVRKYQMFDVEKNLIGQLIGSPLLSNEPLRVYAKAISLGWKETAGLAAKATLSQDLQGMTYVEELEHITGMDLHHLIEYRFRCGSAASTTFEKVDPRELFEYGNLCYDENSYSREWQGYSANHILENLKARPLGSPVPTFDEHLEQTIASLHPIRYRHSDCTGRAQAVCRLLRALQELAAVAEKAVSKVIIISSSFNES
ncbi:hypothetical protein AMATHDRAFT_145597 [Amanita thiersii Skay4041]|uniref:BTB domain-containing protein n=1 Tax=Amanita thiersii Skay4041 TaxID=703135 RepID=A0A2A9NPH8_9AGAR|nr:hypothetical protein AMATHDRAFT_145597 [Amanita thiersii Skay4041]